jgi:hypothetical protein
MTERTAQPERDYTVRVVNTGTGRDETVRVRGADDWKAASNAMMITSLPFKGELAEYWEVRADGTERRMCQRDSPGAQHYDGDGWGTRDEADAR